MTDELIDAVVQVLAAWDWAERPAGVVTMPSRTRPRPDHAASASGSRRSAGCRYLGSLGYASPTGPGRASHNSAQRLRRALARR